MTFILLNSSFPKVRVKRCGDDLSVLPAVRGGMGNELNVRAHQFPG